MFKNLWLAIANRIWPIAPFVLEISDQMMINPLDFVNLRDDRPLAVRAAQGRLSPHGVCVGFGNDDAVFLTTWVFPEGLDLNWRERRALQDALVTWVDLMYGEEGLITKGLTQ